MQASITEGEGGHVGETIVSSEHPKVIEKHKLEQTTINETKRVTITDPPVPITKESPPDDVEVAYDADDGEIDDVSYDISWMYKMKGQALLREAEGIVAAVMLNSDAIDGQPYYTELLTPQFVRNASEVRYSSTDQFY
jgi:hypothetical protein